VLLYNFIVIGVLQLFKTLFCCLIGLIGIMAMAVGEVVVVDKLYCYTHALVLVLKISPFILSYDLVPVIFILVSVIFLNPRTSTIVD
jgi:hypothetical protein